MAMLLSIRDLNIGFRGQGGRVTTAVRGVSFDVPDNSTVALVGESGSGKSVTAMSIVDLLPPNAQRSGQVLWRDADVATLGRAELQRLRGRQIACVFQDPMSSLNPVFSIGNQLCEPLRKHLGLTSRQARVQAEQLLHEVGIAEPARRLGAYPHELSGGQQQRVMIAMALACEPSLLIADEPTTALDVTIQRQVLDLLAQLKRSRRMSLLFISHDLAVVREMADHVVVMQQGVVREQGPAERVFSQPQDAYTRALLACRPALDHAPARLTVIDDVLNGRSAPDAQAPAKAPDAPVLLEVRSLGKSFWLPQGLWRKREFKAVSDVSFTLRRGHTLGVVGESGSGKTTMGLTLLRLHEPTSGEVIFDGRSVLDASEAERQLLRRRIQVVFQNPYASLNPRFTIGETLIEPLRVHAIGVDKADRITRARALLDKVGLPARVFGRYPHEFSGGQRQRIAIARALAVSPELLVLDEAVSALDVSVQAQILNLLKDLQDELGMSYLFISHDLSVVRFMADEVMVLADGRVVEQGSVEQIIDTPQHEYTRRLIAAVPRLHFEITDVASARASGAEPAPRP